MMHGLINIGFINRVRAACATYHYWFSHPDDGWYELQITKFLFLRLSPLSPLVSSFFPQSQLLFSKTPDPDPEGLEPKYCTIHSIQDSRSAHFSLNRGTTFYLQTKEKAKVFAFCCVFSSLAAYRMVAVATHD